LIHKAFTIFSLPCPAEKGSDTVAPGLQTGSTHHDDLAQLCRDLRNCEMEDLGTGGCYQLSLLRWTSERGAGRGLRMGG